MMVSRPGRVPVNQPFREIGRFPCRIPEHSPRARPSAAPLDPDSRRRLDRATVVATSPACGGVSPCCSARWRSCPTKSATRRHSSPGIRVDGGGPPNRYRGNGGPPPPPLGGGEKES